MRDLCRVCGRDLCGTQRRWIFHTSSRLRLLLSHALSRELNRDGSPEFCCSKCAFMLERMYRFDTVIARVQALSIERIHKLLTEKNALRLCVLRLYLKNNTHEAGKNTHEAGKNNSHESEKETADAQDAKYSDLIHHDLAFSVSESWAEKDEDREVSAISGPQFPTHHHHHHQTCTETGAKMARRCGGCANALRVNDSDYEAVCKIPRRVERSASCGPHSRHTDDQPKGLPHSRHTDDQPKGLPHTRHSGEEQLKGLSADPTKCPGPGLLEEAPETGGGPDRLSPEKSTRSGLEVERGGPKGLEVQDEKKHKGSKLPILLRTQEVRLYEQEVSLYEREVRPYEQEVRSYEVEVMWEEFEEMEEEWNDEYVQCGPFRFQQRVMEQQTLQLDHCETTTDQCLSELQTAQTQVHSLQTKIRLSEERNRMLQQRLGEMELELRAVREEAQNQERNLQNLTDSLSSKEQEAADLYRVIEEQNQTLCSFKETAHKQASAGESLSVQSELSSLHLALFRSRLDSDGLQRALKTQDRLRTDLRVALERAEADIQGALERGRDRLQHNQELQACVDRLRSSLRDSEEQLQEAQTQKLRLNQDLTRTISGLQERLRTKDQQLQGYRDLLESEDQDSELHKLKEMIRLRDLELERVMEEKVQSLKQKEHEKLQLQDLLKDKQHDLKTTTELLLGNQETTRSLEVLVRGQSVQMEQLRESLRESGLNQDQVQTELTQVLQDKDSVILGLQEVLQQRDQELQDLNSALVQTWSGPAEVLNQAQLRLQLKDRLLQEVMSERSRQTRDQEDRVRTLVQTIDQRDQYIQDLSPRLLELLKEQSNRISELRTQLSQGLNPDQDLDQDLNQEQVSTLRNHRDQLQRDLEDKNRLIKELVCELRSLRGRLCSDCTQDRGLILGSERDERSPESGGGAWSVM